MAAGGNDNYSPFGDVPHDTKPTSKNFEPPAGSVSQQSTASSTRSSTGSAEPIKHDIKSDIKQEVRRETQTGQAGQAGQGLQTAVTNELRSQGLDARKGNNPQAVNRDAQHTEIVREAPLVKERIHEETTVVDKTQIEEERIKTEVRQIVQPIKEESRRQEDVKSIDHGLEVREHGRAGIDADTQAELERRKQEVASKLNTERDHKTKKISERPDVIQKEQHNVVEQVVPVLEKDIYVPHRVEEEKHIKEIYHEKPVVKETIVEPVITRAEFEKKYGKVESTTGATSMSSQASTGSEFKTSTSASSSSSSVGSQSSNSNPVRETANKVEHKAEQVADSAKAKAQNVANKVQDNTPSGADSSNASTHYSMSADGLARDAHNASSSPTGDNAGEGLGAALKKPFKAVGNLVKDLVD